MITMNKPFQTHGGRSYDNGAPKVNYPDYYLIPFVAVGIGYLMVQLGTNRPWPMLDEDPMVNKSMASSMLCTAAVLFSIAAFNRYLDQRLPWHRHPLSRLGAQYLLCVSIPNLLVAGWQSVFFNEMGVPLHLEHYMRDDFPTVRWMLMIWSLFLMGWYAYSVHGKRQPVEPNAITGGATEQPTGKAPPKPRHTNVYTAHDIAYWQEHVAIFVSEHKHTVAYLANGKQRQYSEPTKFFGEQLPAEQFYVVRSGRLVSRKAIEKVIDRGRYYQLILQEPNAAIEVKTVLDTKVAFRAWWGGPIENK